MSLRGFHIVFIIASIALTTFFGVWALGMHQKESLNSYMVTAYASFAATLGLLVYGAFFIKKVKTQ